MVRLIDADALLESLNSEFARLDIPPMCKRGAEWAKLFIENAPTAEQVGKDDKNENNSNEQDTDTAAKPKCI